MLNTYTNLTQSLVAATAAVVLSVASIGVTVAPVHESPACISVPADATGQQLVCSLA